MKKIIERPEYLKKLIASRNNGFPKVITGIRRCGKSFLLKEIYCSYLIKQGIKESNIIIIDLDDDKNVNLRNPIELGKHIRNLVSKNEQYYVVIDEIQLVERITNPIYTNGKIIKAKSDDANAISFVDVVLGLSHEKNIDLYITGSNSKMLSTDIITEFRDKATNIKMSPLSFDEYYNYVQGSPYDAFYDYLQYGGMPLAVLKNDDDRKEYLKDLFEMVYFKDIIEHNNLRKGETLDELANIISEQVGTLLNSDKISKTYNSVKHKAITSITIENYILMFIDCFLLKEARRYDLKGRKEIGALRKYYFIDTGLRNARLNFVFKDEGQMIENVVYNELCYNGYSVNVGTFDTIGKDKLGNSVRKTNEVDFYAVKGNKEYYVQVSNDISNRKTIDRETKPYFLLNDQVKKILVINKPIKETKDENGFTIIGVVDFLLRFIK